MGAALLLAALLAWAPAAGAGPVAVHVLDDFDGSEPLRHWRLRAVTAEPVAAGSVRLRFPAWSPGGEEWPAAILEHGSAAFTEKDWSRFDRLTFAVRNETGAPALVKLRLDDSGGRQAVRTFALPARSRHTCLVPIDELSGALDVRRVVHFDLYMSRPERDYALLLAAPRLEADSLAIEGARLVADPFGGEAVRASARCGRVALWEVRVLDETGQVVALQAHRATRLRWSWKADGPGVYRAVARAVDPFWRTGAVVAALGEVRVLPEAERPGLVAWTVPTTRKVMLDDRPDGEPVLSDSLLLAETAPTADIDMARNEHEGVQVVLLSRRAHGLEVDVGELRHALSGALLPADDRRLYRVGYVRTRDPGVYDVERSGWWPDPLLPATGLRLVPGECLPLWLSVRTRAGSEPGEYRGWLALRLDGVPAGRLAVVVRVHPVLVPDSSSVRTAFSLYEDRLQQVYGEVNEDLRRRYHDFVAEHRLNVDHLYRAAPPRLADLQRLASRQRLNAFNLLYLRADGEYDDAHLQVLGDRLQPVVEELRRAGLFERAYVYGFDEVGAADFPRLQRAFGYLKQRFPGLRTATTARDAGLGADSGLDEAVDIWVPLTAAHDSSAAAAARQRGDEVWWYICISPRHPYANWFVEYPAIEARLLGWMTWQQRVTGFLYYTLNRWPGRERPLVADGSGRTDWDPASYRTANGDGCLLYAGPAGPLSTVRLENVRDGLEDYELLVLAGEVEGRALCGRLIRSLTDYDRDPVAFGEVRRQLLRAASGERAAR